MLQPLAAFFIAGALSLVLSRMVRRTLFRFRSRERKEGKEQVYRHFPRVRKPLGGGVAMLVALAVALLLIRPEKAPESARVISLLLVTLAFGLIGALDDWRKVRGHGLREWQKLLAQAIVSLAFGAYLLLVLHHCQVYFPFEGTADLSWGYLAWAVLVMVATSNAVNLADGIDGLAAGSVTIASAAFILLHLLLPEMRLLLPAAALAGACLGFLVYNLPPARLIMGDTGALGLGAALGAMALLGRVEWLLIPVGAVFVVDALSVILQTSSIRFFRRPVRLLRHQTTEIFRPFLCAPVHHHFQFLAWEHKRILTLFLGLGAFCGFLALGAASSDWVWLLGLLIMAVFLLAAALQKFLSANFFLGLHGTPEGEIKLAAFRGWPAQVFGRPLFRLHRTTPITEAMLGAMTAESILWRPISEIEASIVLGKIYAEQRLYEQAIREWEQVPVRNLLLRESVVLQLAKLYYAKDWLLKAIQLWERLPEQRVERLPGLSDTIRAAKVRLAHVAGKSYTRNMRLYAEPGARINNPEHAVTELQAARRFNEELLSLLAYERDRTELLLPSNSTEANEQKALFRRMERTVLGRLRALDGAINRLQEQLAAAQGHELTAASEEGLSAENEQRAQSQALEALGISGEQLAVALGLTGRERARIRDFQLDETPSRNIIHRMVLQRPGEAPKSVVVKRYDERQISFFAACYRRERNVLELLRRYGANVPEVVGGYLGPHHALLLMADVGRETLAQYLAEADETDRLKLLTLAVDGLVDLHYRARQNLAELEREIRKIVKERLDEDYYFNTLRIAIERILELSGRPLLRSEWLALREQCRPVVELLRAQPKSFVHFEYVPHNLLVRNGVVTPIDFEQATLGPAEFDLVALLRSPEADLPPALLGELLDHYLARLQATGEPATRPSLLQVFDYANLVKGLFYAGAAAHFFSRYREASLLQRRDWHLRDVDGVLTRHRELATLRGLLMVRLERDLGVPLQT